MIEDAKLINLIDNVWRKLDKFNSSAMDLINFMDKDDPDLCSMLESSISHIMKILEEFQQKLIKI